jgi:hypothetical protein
MKRIPVILLFSAIMILAFTSICPASVTMTYTYVPPYGSFDNLRGRVQASENPGNYKVAVYILIDGGGWWIKPQWNSFINVNPDGTWECDITTGGVDEYALKIIAYLLPVGYNPANRSREMDEQNSVATATAVRPARTISFSGLQWSVKSSIDEHQDKYWRVDPGGNFFSHQNRNVWVDAQGRLHLRITREGDKWYCAEVMSLKTFGYGTYTFQLVSGFENINENVVLGLFVYDDEAPFPSREIDIEFSRWGMPLDQNGQYVVQPWDVTGNRFRFDFVYNGTGSVHRFQWRPQQVRFSSGFKNAGSLVSWNYYGSHVPREGKELVRINLWLNNANGPSDGQEVEVIIEKFLYEPLPAAVALPHLFLLLGD